MDIAEKFESEIARCLPLLEAGEWAMANARDSIVSEVEPHEAFSSVVSVLTLSVKQSDEYAFLSCCWLAAQLANISGTTERPKGLIDALKKSHIQGASFSENTASEVNKIAKWYRVEYAI